MTALAGLCGELLGHLAGELAAKSVKVAPGASFYFFSTVLLTFRWHFVHQCTPFPLTSGLI